MSARSGLPALLAELAAMSDAARRSILQELSPEEREALSREPVPASPAPATGATLSPWLELRIDAARERVAGPAALQMTAATRQALLRSVGATSHGAPAPQVAASPGRSLFDTFGSKLAARMGRP